MNVVDLVQSDGIELKRVAATRGGEFAGPCPLCGGSDRFRVWPGQGEGGRWWCFEEACQCVGRVLPIRPNPLSNKRSSRPPKQSLPLETGPQEEITLSDRWQTMGRKLIDEAVYHLWNTQKDLWLRWLTEQRGLTEKTIRANALGVLPADRWDNAEDWGLEAELKEDGQAKKLHLPKGHVIPLLDGPRVLRIKFRRPKFAGEPRYLLLKSSSSQCRLINPDNSLFVITENELDGLLIAQEGEVWEVVDKDMKLIEVKYVGTHEGADYRRIC